MEGIPAERAKAKTRISAVLKLPTPMGVGIIIGVKGAQAWFTDFLKN